MPLSGSECVSKSPCGLLLPRSPQLHWAPHPLCTHITSPKPLQLTVELAFVSSRPEFQN